MTSAENHHSLQRLCETGHYGAAVALAEALLADAPDKVDLWHILGAARSELGALDAAADAFYQATALSPEDADAHYNLGCILQRLNKNAGAIDAFASAVRCDPNHANAYNNLGNVLRDVGQLQQSIAALGRALRLDPSFGDAANNLVMSLRAAGQLAEAMALAQGILAQRPDDAAALSLLLRIKADAGDFSRFDDFAKVKETFGIATRALPPFSMMQIEDHPARLFQRIERWSTQTFPTVSPPEFETRPPDKLRIGYFSSNFNDHPGLFLTAGMFREHDKSQFDVSAYSMTPQRPSTLRDTLVGEFSAFHDVHALSDHQIAALARSHNLDIAIDLDGHTKRARLGVFAQRVAPVQVCHLGFPGPMCVEFCDYTVADDIVVSPELRPNFSKSTFFLPDAYMPTDNARVISPQQTKRQDHGLPQDAIVLCCFNDVFKIGRDEFDIWMRVLGKVEGSVLWLLGANPLMQTNLTEAAVARGIDAARLIFAGRLPQAEHLERYRHADLFVDTFICNAHTTATDALWAGLPVITKQGAQFAARVASSLITAAGQPELITTSDAAYEKLIEELCLDPTRRAQIRAQLAQNLETCALFDTLTYTRNFEAGLREMHRRYHANESNTDIRLG